MSFLFKAVLCISAVICLNAEEVQHLHALSDSITERAAEQGKSALTRYRLANGRIIASGPEIIIRLDTPASLEAVRQQWMPLRIEPLSKQLYLLTFKTGSDIPALCEALAADPMIVYAHPNIHSEKQLR